MIKIQTKTIKIQTKTKNIYYEDFNKTFFFQYSCLHEISYFFLSFVFQILDFLSNILWNMTCDERGPAMKGPF